MIHSSPSSCARVVSPARSEPEPGSLNNSHQRTSLVAIGRRNRRFTSSDPYSTIAGAARSIPMPTLVTPTAPARSSSSVTTSTSPMGNPFPYHSCGHVGQPQPESTSFSRHCPNAKSRVQNSLSHARTSERTAASSAESLNAVTSTKSRTSHCSFVWACRK